MVLSRVVLEIFNVQKYPDLEIPVKGQSRSLNAVHSIDWVWVPISVHSNFFIHNIFEIFDFKNAVTLKTGLWVCHGR